MGLTLAGAVTILWVRAVSVVRRLRQRGKP